MGCTADSLNLTKYVLYSRHFNAHAKCPLQ